MIQLTTHTRILLATQPIDFRKGIDGIVAVCRRELGQDPKSGTCFVFINRSKIMVRVLVYDGTGFWLMTKRLSAGRFQGWPTCSSTVSALAARRLSRLLLGHDPAAVPVGHCKPERS